MSSFKYVASYPLFYPAKQDAEGNSLMATQGVVVDWDVCPDAAVWVATGEAPTWDVPAPVKAPEPEPEVPADPEPESGAEAPKPLFPGYQPPVSR